MVEALAVLAIAAVLVSVAVPSLGALVGSSRLTAAANELLADLFLTPANP